MDDAKRKNRPRVSVGWLIGIGVVCLGATVFVFNRKAHALWMSGHSVEAGAVWGHRADGWFGVFW